MAEAGSQGGGNNEGGATSQNTGLPGGNLTVSAIQVNFPQGPSNARWKLGPDGAYHSGGFKLSNQSPGGTIVYFEHVDGFMDPPPFPVTLVGGQLTTVERTYFGITSQPQDQTVAPFWCR